MTRHLLHCVTTLPKRNVTITRSVVSAVRLFLGRYLSCSALSPQVVRSVAIEERHNTTTEPRSSMDSGHYNDWWFGGVSGSDEVPHPETPEERQQ